MGTITSNKQGLKMLIAGAVLQFSLGIIYVWSVFVNPVSDYLNWDIEAVKLTSSFMLGFFAIGILAGGKMQAKFESQKIVLMGGLLMASGIFITAFIPPGIPWLIYISYGMSGGFGVGAAYGTIISSAQKWFPKNRGFANGITVCAFGLATVVFAPLIGWLNNSFGLQMTLFILSGTFFMVTISLFRFIKQPGEANTGKAASSVQPEQKQYTLNEALATREFYFITLSLMFVTATFFTLNPSFITLAIERGLEPAMGTALVMVTGVANAMGRLLVPLLSDKIGRNNGALFILLLTSVCAFLLCFAESVPFIFAVALIVFCYGGTAGIYPVITADYFGVKNVGANFGAVMVGFALSALFFPMLIGLLPNWLWKFTALAVLAFISVILILLLTARRNKKTPD
jgi:OFA family oxalate/formate antiporter-like MFS transporter